MCNICGNPDYLRCNCQSTQPYCDQCSGDNTCENVLDLQCAFYHLQTVGGPTPPPSKLINLGLLNGASAQQIVEAIDALIGTNFNIPFKPVDTDSISWATGGPAGHTPKANVNLSEESDNQIVLLSDGLYVPSGSGGDDHKVKVDVGDNPDYLEDQIEGGDDGIVFNTVINDGGILKILPTIDISALLSLIINTPGYLNLLCEATAACSGGPTPATVDDLDCLSAIVTGTYISDSAVTGTIEIPYSGGNGGFYNAISVNSTGVTGLTASADAGNDAVGDGTLILDVSGTPSASGGATFAINFGGQSCNVTINVDEEGGTISSLNCAGATVTPHNFVFTGPTSGEHLTVNYTGGNGGSYAGQTINSTGITGLTLTLAPGTFATGSGSLIFNIGGSASSTGTASFLLNIGGQACTVNVTVYSIEVSSTLAGTTLSGTVGGFSFGPINPGGRAQGVHTAFTSTICVTVSGTPSVPSNLTLFKNGVLVQCINVTTSGTYCFTSAAYVLGDHISISGNTGTC